MADSKPAAVKAAERNSATQGEDGHAPVLATTDPRDAHPEANAKANTATPPKPDAEPVTVEKGEDLTREELADRAKRNSATPAGLDSKPVLVRQPDVVDDDALTPTEFAARNAKAVKSSPENKSAAPSDNK